MTLLPPLRQATLVAIIALLILSALTRLVYASLAEPIDEATDGPLPTAESLLCPASEEVATLLEQIARRSDVLDERETAAAMREQDIEVARQEIGASLGRMAEAEARLAARMERSANAADEDLTRLVEVYEGMKPKDAAVLFEAMDPAFAAGFMSRMASDAASALFSHLSPDKAYALSVIMAGRNANAATE